MSSQSPRSMVPRFDKFTSSSERASNTLSHVRRTGTRCERLLCAELRGLGLQCEQNVAELPGKPDIVLVAQRAVVFCDGDFWHGRHWNQRRARLKRGANARYWVAKIESNRARDRRRNRQLRELGWRVFRVWEGDIQRDARGAAQKILRRLTAR